MAMSQSIICVLLTVQRYVLADSARNRQPQLASATAASSMAFAADRSIPAVGIWSAMTAKASVVPFLSVTSPARAVTVPRLPVLARTEPRAAPPIPANTLCPADSVPEKPATGRPASRGRGRGELDHLDQRGRRDRVLR